MVSRGIVALAVLALCVVPLGACRTSDMLKLAYTDNDACSTCKFAVRVLSDMLCDPYVDNSVVQWHQLVCSQVSDKAQCRDLVRGLAPAAVQWLRMNADPETMCGSISVCGAAPHVTNPFKAQPKNQLHANRPNDMTCPLCMFVAGKVKEQMADPAFQDSIREASMAACAQLPEGMMQDTCNMFVEQYEMTYFKYLADLEPVEVCMMIGTCMDTALHKLQAERGAPLLQLSPAHLEPVRQIKQAIQAAAAAAPRNDHCETCKVVVQEMRTVVADPKLQAQIVDYAKQACSVFPSYQATCEADVEQYAPMAFGMVLAYLQPEQVCIQLKMCPPPSIFNMLNQALGLQTNLLGAKFASFSIITTHSTPTGITTITSSSSTDDLDDTADSSSVSSSSSPHQAKQITAKAKVHGPGLALPMAS
jgi:saposin